jgi:hypothetical protein
MRIKLFVFMLIDPLQQLFPLRLTLILYFESDKLLNKFILPNFYKILLIHEYSFTLPILILIKTLP